MIENNLCTHIIAKQHSAEANSRVLAPKIVESPDGLPVYYVDPFVAGAKSDNDDTR